MSLFQMIPSCVSSAVCVQFSNVFLQSDHAVFMTFHAVAAWRKSQVMPGDMVQVMKGKDAGKVRVGPNELASGS